MEKAANVQTTSTPQKNDYASLRLILCVFRILSQSFHIVIVSTNSLVIVTALSFVVRIVVCFDYLPFPSLCPVLAHKAHHSDYLKREQENHNTSQRKTPD